MKKITPTSLIKKLPAKRQAYVRGLLAGQSKRQAALNAGYSESVANNAKHKLETGEIMQTLATIVKQHVPHELIAKKVRKALFATKTIVYGSKALPQIMTVDDHFIILQAAKLAAQLEGELGEGGKGGDTKVAVQVVFGDLCGGRV